MLFIMMVLQFVTKLVTKLFYINKVAAEGWSRNNCRCKSELSWCKNVLSHQVGGPLKMTKGFGLVIRSFVMLGGLQKSADADRLSAFFLFMKK